MTKLSAVVMAVAMTAGTFTIAAAAPRKPSEQAKKDADAHDKAGRSEAADRARQRAADRERQEQLREQRDRERAQRDAKKKK